MIKLRSSAGFTYIAVLVSVVIMGILLGQAAGVWKTTMQRERETELIFRGTQIRDALRRYYWPGAAGAAALASKPTTLPSGIVLNELKDLLQDPKSGGKKRYLRKLYLDPITGKEWDLVKDANQRIIGVASSSGEEPIKKGNFPLELPAEDFEGKKKYSEWQFICTRWPGSAASGGVRGLSKPSQEPDE